MGFLKKIIKAPIKLHKKVAKTGKKIVKKTTPGMGGGGGKHLKAGTRSGGKRAVARNARAAMPTAARTVRKAAAAKRGAGSRVGATVRTQPARAAVMPSKAAVRKAPVRSTTGGPIRAKMISKK